MHSQTLESHLSFELNLILKFEVLVCFFLDYQFVVDRGEGVTGPWTWQWQAPQFGQILHWGWLDVYSL